MSGDMCTYVIVINEYVQSVSRKDHNSPLLGHLHCDWCMQDWKLPGYNSLSVVLWSTACTPQTAYKKSVQCMWVSRHA